MREEEKREILTKIRRMQGDKHNNRGSDAKEKPGGKQLVVHHADAVKPEPVEWIWPGRIAIGKTTLVGGDPGLGKSQLSIFITASITVAGEWPCREGRPAAKRSVIMLSAEDGVADTIVPRLMAAGADRSKVKIVTAVHEADGTGRRIFNLTHDLDVLEKLIVGIGDVGLVIIDPVDAYIGGNVDSHKSAAVRAVLEPISELADRLDVAILALTHFSKQAGGKAIYRFIGSIAHIGAARIAFAVVADQEDKTRVLLLHAKNNLAPPQKGLAFRIQQHVLTNDGVIGSSVFFEPEYVTGISADEALAAESGSGQETAKDEAADFLRVVLANGRVKIQDIEAEGRSAGLLGEGKQIRQSKPFRDAKTELGIESERDGFGPGAVYYWSLPPDSMRAPSDPMRAHHKNRAHMENEGAHDEKEGGEDDRDEGGPSLHARPQTPCAPSFLKGAHEGAHGSEVHGGNGPEPAGDDLTIPDILRRDRGHMVANGFAISGNGQNPEDRREPEPGQIFARVWVREIRPVPLGPPGDSSDDFVR